MGHGTSWLNRITSALVVVLLAALITRYVAGLLEQSFGVVVTLLILLGLYRLIIGRR